MTPEDWFKHRRAEASCEDGYGLSDVSRKTRISINRLTAFEAGTSHMTDREFRTLWNCFERYVEPKAWIDLKKQILGEQDENSMDRT